jgi:sugar lactone lactonase YvrE
MVGLLILAASATAQSERKLALVIGISGYEDRVGRLPKAESDAKSVGAALEKIGFRVYLLLDASRADWLPELSKFTSSIAAGDVVLLYYAGHGVQLNGGNYLLPSDFSGVGSDVTQQGILLDDVIQRINARSPKLKIFVIDACRDNPFDKNLRSGLANVNAVAYGSGTYIAMAASPGQLATDGLFARHFVDVLGIPGLEVRQVFTEVRKGVERESGNREVPFGADLLSENYILTPSNPRAPLQRVKVLKTGPVQLATLSPDGRVVATSGLDGSIQLWSVGSGEAIGSLRGPETRTLSFHFSPDSKLVAAGGEKALWVWDVETKKSRKFEDKGMSMVVSSSFSSDGKHLVASSKDKGLRVWNVETGEPEASLKLPIQGGWSTFVPGPKMDTVFVLGQDAKQQFARLWNWRSKESSPLSGSFTGVNCLAFAPDGRTLIAGMRDGTIRSWILSDGGLLLQGRVFEGHTRAVDAVAFTSDGRRLASAGADKTFRWWDVESARQLRFLDTPSSTERMLGLWFVSDGGLLAATVRGSEIEIWQIPRP